jgi:uncharacterized protein YegJ (DUF2314 family)
MGRRVLEEFVTGWRPAPWLDCAPMSPSGCLRVALLAVLLAGCKERATARRAPADDAAVAGVIGMAAPAPLGPARVGPAHSMFLVYVGDGVDVRAIADRELAGEPDLRRAVEPGIDGPLPAVSVREPTLDLVPVPEPELLVHFSVDLTPAEAAKAAAVKKAVAIAFEYTPETATAVLARAHRIVGRIAAASKGLVWVDETRLMYGASWKERTAAVAVAKPMATTLTNVHMYRPDDEPGIRLVSLGMIALGLPDLVMEDMPPGFAEEAGALLAIVAQQLLQGTEPAGDGSFEVRVDALVDADGKPMTPPGEGATGAATLRLVTATPEDGDPDNRLWAITFPGDGALPERQAAVLHRLFGRTGGVKGVSADDPEIAAVTRKVQKGLPGLKRRFAKRQSVEHLQVKAGFATPDGNHEYMWVDVQTWKGKTLRGVLMNEPLDAELTKGAPVDVDDGAIIDYMFHKADGSTEGGESNDILERRMNEAD